jgi:alkanesulfonate monooxygenase SsuD/methylene tetrahydromethanopterin reductase-like flavin-dependent oxidoreductase (luciferase family)
MPSRPTMEFGYNPPTGVRGLEVIRPREYISDLHRALDVASQSFGSLWISDHINYADEFRMECWTLLSWIAARYPGPKLSTIVMSNTFRSPALLAKMAASLQHLSSGRFILGYGGGWHEGEHRAFGYDYPSPRTRIDMLEEGVQVIRKLWTESPTSFDGRFYNVDGAHCEPLPDPVPPIMIGGAGEKRTLKVVAKHADWWNDLSRPLDQARHKLDVLRQHCEAEGRDYDSIRKTFTARFFIDRSNSKAREQAGDWLTAEQPGIAGDPASIRDQLGQLAELGFDLCIAVFPQFQELDDMRLFADEVIPEFA